MIDVVLISKYCEESGENPDKVKMRLDGYVLDPDGTPEDEDLDDADLIDVTVM